MSAQDQASEAMEVFNELMESEVSIIIPHVSSIVGFCLEVGADCVTSGFAPHLCLKFAFVFCSKVDK